MDILVEHCAGLDVHRDTVVATVRIPPDSPRGKRRVQHTQTFATTTAGITKLGDWLAGHRVTRTRVVQRLEKVMQDAGIKLTSVASALLTKSGRAMLEALLAGQTDPEALAELARGRLRSNIPA